MCDNKAAINLSNNPIIHDKTKPMRIVRHFIRERIDLKYLILPYLKTRDQVADIFNKNLSIEISREM